MNDESNLNKCFFSVSFGLIVTNELLPYDLYVNSSTHAKREKFVRIFKKGNTLSTSDLELFRGKYYQLYVDEDERPLYLKSLIKVESASDVEKIDFIKGSAIEYLKSVFDSEHEFTNEVLEEALEGCKDTVNSMVDVIEEYGVHDIQKLIADLSFHDFYTYDHSINVGMYSISIFRAIKPDATREEMVMAGMGGLLHDLGKVKIPTRIINNPGKLSDDDFDMIKKHPGYGLELLEHYDCPHGDIDYDLIKRVVYEHHENYNGTGYPNQLKGNDISVFARITAIADFYDAITTKRSYHEVLSTEDALEVMARSVGRKIDPKIFQVFQNNVNSILSGRSNQELPDDFDPCQPHNVLPLKKVANIQRTDFIKKESEDYGKVKTRVTKKKIA